MMKLVQNLLICFLLFTIASAFIEARPQGVTADGNQDLDAIEQDGEEVRGAYYDLPGQAYYPNVPIDRLQMLLAQYRPTAYLRAPTMNNINELFRVPESKRQVRYRQCYFNPISCFKK